MSGVEGIFSLRIVTVDFYMEKPKPGLDPCFSEFRAKEIKKLPIIRIFGSNAEGQKTCMHVHGIFPYLYIPYDKKDFESADKAVYLIASSIDKALNISLGQGISNSQHVFKIQLVKGIPFYGYHQKEHQYLKIYMLNPRFVRRVANLLQNGAIMGKIFQPHESHVPYILQFFIDYNLYGMSFLHVPKEVLKFRKKNENDVVPYATQKGQVLDTIIALKQSTSALEVDIGSAFILNRFQLLTKASAHTNPGIESIWQDERIRRQQLSKECDEVPLLEIPVSQDRPDVKPTESEEFFRAGLKNKLDNLEKNMDHTLNASHQTTFATPETSIKEKKRTFNLKKLIANAVYPEECSQDDLLTNASFIADHLSTRSIFSTSTNFSKTPPVPDSEDVFMDDTIVDEQLVFSLTQPDFLNQSLREQDIELLDVMKQLEEREDENDIDLDSTLAPLSQNLSLNSSQKEINGALNTTETSTLSMEGGDSDNECVNDFSIVMDDMDELLLKLSQSSQPKETISGLAQCDGADDILKTPKKIKQRNTQTTPKTPVTPKRLLKSGETPRTPTSVAKKYNPLPLIIHSRSLKKNLLCETKQCTTSVDETNKETISDTSKESEGLGINTPVKRVSYSLRKKLALSELRRKSAATNIELKGEKTTPLPNHNRGRRKTIDMDKTHITCNLRTPRRQKEKKLRVYDSVKLSEVESRKSIKGGELRESQKEAFSSEPLLHIENNIETYPKVLIKKSPQIKLLSMKACSAKNGEYITPTKQKKSNFKERKRLVLRSVKRFKDTRENHKPRRNGEFSANENISHTRQQSLTLAETYPVQNKQFSHTRKLRICLKRLSVNEIKRFISSEFASKSPKTPLIPARQRSFIEQSAYKDRSHLDEFKFSNISTPCTPKRAVTDSDSDNAYEPTVRSFYEKSFLIDSPVISEVSISSPIQAANSNLESYSPDDDKLVTITPRLLPETYEEVEKNCKIYNIPDMIHPTPFYSNYADVTHKKEVGHTVLSIPGNTLNDLEDFQSTISNLGGLYIHRKKVMQTLGVSFRSESHIREYLSTEKVVVITPCKLPPTMQDAKVWIKARELLKVKCENKGNIEEDSPIKVRRQKVVMLLGDESCASGEDMDSSMRSLSLTPLTPVIVNKNETPNTADSLNTTLIATTSNRKSAKRRSIRAKVSLSQKLKDICLTNALEKCCESPTRDFIAVNKRCNERTSSHDSLNSNDTISSEAAIAELEKSSFVKNVHSSQGSFNDSFGLSIATLNNTYGFKVNLENLQEAKSDIEHNFLTTLSLEVFVPTREDLLPDPEFDAIICIFYAIENSIPTTCKEGVSKTRGFILVSEENSSINSKFNGIDSDAEIKVVKSELEGLLKLLELCAFWDPDIYVGYEIEMSSWGYVMERAKFLDLNIAPLLSRVPTQKVLDFVDEDREQLTDLNVETKLCGRILLDVWRLMRSEIALTSYTFENVMYHILHRRCPLHTHRELSQWFQMSQTRWIVLEYYLERVKGTLELLDQLDLIGRTSEMAKLIGIQFYEVLSRGSQFRVESMMLRIAKPKNLVPLSPSVNQRAHMRAPEYLPLILEPESRFYPDPVIVLDFQSLYPSMIMAYNYCFSTCLGRVEHLGLSTPFEFGASQLRVSSTLLKNLLNQDLVTISPCGVVYVKREIREGILPRMLTEVLDTRQMVKQSMKLHKSSTALQRILHSRQLGLKLIANVTYGYTAANFSGRMPCVEVGDSVVAKGRETLERAIKFVEANKKWNVRVVYGDTDSLFVLVPGRSRADAFRIGAEIAESITQDNPQPVKLKLEKVYQPCFLQTKKRYVGYMYESPDQEEPIFEAKGIETVRRDGCPAASKMLEKCLKILFESADVSQVKSYVCRQFTKLLSGKANIQDLIFAKEFRGLNGYKPTACVPALELTRKWIQTDPRRIPRRGERVPFIVTNGPPGVPLIKLVRSPHDVLNDEGLKINAIYYITKAIIPPLNRCLLLIGADVNEWFTNLPRKVLFTPALSVATEVISTNGSKKSTISQYFSSTNCMIDCGRQTKQGICTFCSLDATKSVVTLEDKKTKLQRAYYLTQMICQACCGRPNFTNCASLDCPVLYVLEVKRRDLAQITHIQSIIDERDDSYWKEEIYESIQNLKQLTQASGLNLYWIHHRFNTIYNVQKDARLFENENLPTDDKRHLVKLAAQRKQIIFVKNVDKLLESNPEIEILFNASSFICAPILNNEQKVLLILEIYKTDNASFSQRELDYTLEFLKWFTIWIAQRYEFNQETNVFNIRDSLMVYVLEYVNDSISYEKFLSRFLAYCKIHLKVHKWFLYEQDIKTEFCDFYEEINQKLTKTGNRLKFLKINTFCHQVWQRQSPLIVRVEAGCDQLDKEIKQDPENPLRFMIFYPLMYGKQFLGILVFGKNEEDTQLDFSEDDKVCVSIMASLLGNALIYRYINQEKGRMAAQTELRRQTLINMLQARLRPGFAISGNVNVPKNLNRINFELTDFNDPNQLTYLCKIFQATYSFNWDRLKAFLLSVQLSHNTYPYHNIKTTFHIARTVYCIIYQLGTKLMHYERAALMIAAVIYYSGHNGLSNQVMRKTKHPLTEIYKTYMKENHRVWMLHLLLDQTMLLSDKEESDVIISTTSALLMQSKKYESKDFRLKISKMLDSEKFNQTNAIHRLYVLLVILRVGVHGRHMQPFNVEKQLRNDYYEDILRLGDLARMQGYELSDQKNREMKFKVSHFEIDYIKNSVLPTLEILTRLFPETDVLTAMPNDVLKAHTILVNAGNKKLWDPEACIRNQ